MSSYNIDVFSNRRQKISLSMQDVGPFLPFVTTYRLGFASDRNIPIMIIARILLHPLQKSRSVTSILK